MSLDYRQAGVDIAAADDVLRRVKGHLGRGAGPAVLRGLGDFASLFDLSEVMTGYRQPVLVQSVDGVGTKTALAAWAGHYRGLGQDLFAAVCNDVAVSGAKLLTFLDYVAQSRLDPNVIEQVVSDLVDCCQRHGVSLVGGETAEMPGVYQHDRALELVGVGTGVVERGEIVDGSAVRPGDRVYGFSSSGLHTNGYSLVRKLFLEQERAQPGKIYPELGEPLAEVLLRPHRDYLGLIRGLLRHVAVKGLAHITGGGVPGNVLRILPIGLGVALRPWPWPPLFELIAQLGDVPLEDMRRTFNLGVGLVAICSDEGDSLLTMRQLAGECGADVIFLGEVVSQRENDEEVLRWG